MVEPFPVAAFLRSGSFLRRPDGRTILGWGLRRATTPDASVAFYAPDFFLEDAAPWWIPSAVLTVSENECPPLVGGGPAPETLSWNEPSRAHFGDAFATVQQWFRHEGVAKAVVAAFATSAASVSEEHRRASVTAAWRLPNPFLPCGLWHDGEGFLSATPELLFEKRGGTLTTMALAATRPSSAATPWTEKERREHALVADDLQTTLAPFGAVHVGMTGERAVGPMTHLHAPVQCTGPALEKLALDDCVRALHPTAALGVAPRSFSWTRLRELDGSIDRRRFGAPFAFRDAEGDAVAVVAIRSVQWDSQGAMLGSGAGILPESDREAEWRELALKRRATCEALGL